MNVSGRSDWFAPGRMAVEASPETAELISAMGRTEDVRLSPDNRRLAVVAYTSSRIYLFAVQIDESLSTPRVRVIGHRILVSSAIEEPHGVAFLDDDHIVVCNRAADLCIFRLPDDAAGGGEVTLVALKVLSGRGTILAKVKNPGSVDCHKIADGVFRVLICNNFWNFISSHIVTLGETVSVRSEGRLVDPRIRIPDGISVSPDAEWTAVSNHADGEVLVYRNAAPFDRNSTSVAALKGLVCPHGLKFAADGSLLVADAASPYLHVFRCEGKRWSGVHGPSQSIRMMDDETLYNGKYDFREGGIKGIDLNRTNRVLIVTHLLEPLGFYHLPGLLRSNDEVSPAMTAEFCRQRDASFVGEDGARLQKRWTARQRVNEAIQERRRRWWAFQRQVQLKRELLAFSARSELSREPLLDARGPVVSLTTHAGRIESVHYAIESIGRGSLKPSRIVLWVTDPEIYRRLPRALQRLQARGLEVQLSEEFGPHSKYWPYVASAATLEHPLVTADDDVLYKEDWLRDLVLAWTANRGIIHCHRARRMGIVGVEFTPYSAWPLATDSVPSHLNFITGVGGVIYPPEFLSYLKRQGPAFGACCPLADDIWLSASALWAGFKIGQVRAEAYRPVSIPGSQGRRLYTTNVLEGANQLQLRRTFGLGDMAKLREELEADTQRAEAVAVQ